MSSTWQKGDDKNTRRKIRILVSDPDATDSSSDEEQEERPGKSKRLFHEILINNDEAVAAPEKTVVHKDIDSQLDSFSGAIHPLGTQHITVNMDGSPRKKYVGAHRRRSGRYSAEVKDPIQKKKVWLGTFDTAEEAHKAYITKKAELKKQLASRKNFQFVVSKESEPMLDIDGLNLYHGGSETSHSDEGKIGEENVVMQNNGGPDTVQVLGNASAHEDTDSRLNFSVAIHPSGRQNATAGTSGNPIKKYVGVRMTSSGKFSAQIKDPTKGKRVYLGTFNTAEEAHKAYLTRKVEIEKKNASGKGFRWVVSKESESLPDIDGSKLFRGGSETSCFNEGKIIGKQDELMQKNTGSSTEQVLAMVSVQKKIKSGAGQVTNFVKDGIENNADSAIDESIEDGVGSNGGSVKEEVSPIVNGQEVTYSMNFSGTYKSPSSILEFESPDWSSGGSETGTINAEAMQNVDDPVKEQFCQDPDDAFPRIDNHGFILGKWSWIDDLSICRIEETHHV